MREYASLGIPGRAIGTPLGLSKRSLLLGMRLREEGQKLLLIGHADQKTRKVGPTFPAEYRFLTTPTLPQNLQSLQKTMSFEVVDVTPKGMF